MENTMAKFGYDHLHFRSEDPHAAKEFWENMAFLLEKANKLNIYDPVDYSENNIDYCGMEITTTRYDFKK